MKILLQHLAVVVISIPAALGLLWVIQTIAEASS